MVRGPYRRPPADRRTDLSVDAVFEHVAWEAATSIDKIRGPRQSGVVREARLAAVWLSYRLCKVRSDEIGRATGRGDRRSVYDMLARAEQLREQDPDFRRFTDGVSLCLVAATA